MCLCLYANEGCTSKIKDSVYNTHLNFGAVLSEKKGKYSIQVLKFGSPMDLFLKKIGGPAN